MQALEKPRKEDWGIDYLPHLTKKFDKLIQKAKDRIGLFSKKEISATTFYFEVKGEDSGYVCCDNEDCIMKTKSLLEEKHKDEVTVCCYANDGDHERIEVCCQCGKPLNEWLTWCESELEYLEENQSWTSEFLQDESFLIHCILQSQPTHDYSITFYQKREGGKLLEEALERREDFFQRIEKLVRRVLMIKEIKDKE